MGPSTPPSMGPSGGEGAVVAGLGPFALVRCSAGQGHGQKRPVTLPRYATLESARSIERPSMGLLRRPTTSGIVEDGRLGRPCGPGAHSRASQKTNLRLRRYSRIHADAYVTCSSAWYPLIGVHWSAVPRPKRHPTGVSSSHEPSIPSSRLGESCSARRRSASMRTDLDG